MEVKTYQGTKRELSVVDYSDLITLSTRLVRESSEIAATIRDRYKVVVLDEYQDTNPAQRVLLTSIFGGGFPVVAVGDIDQTIYEWRGASADSCSCRIRALRKTRRGYLSFFRGKVSSRSD